MRFINGLMKIYESKLLILDCVGRDLSFRWHRNTTNEVIETRQEFAPQSGSLEDPRNSRRGFAGSTMFNRAGNRIRRLRVLRALLVSRFAFPI